MEESNLKTIIQKKISNRIYSKHKISDILKENNVWEEEWNKIKERDLFINILFENFDEKDIFNFIWEKEKKKDRKRRETLLKEFEELAIEDESILFTFNLDDLENTIKEFKSNNSTVSNKNTNFKKSKKTNPLESKLKDLGFIDISIKSMIKSCEEKDLNEYTRRLENYRRNNPFESNSQAYKDKTYPTNPYVKACYINEDYNLQDIRLISEIFEAINKGFTNIIVYDKEFNTPDNLISLAKLYNNAFILVNNEDKRKDYEIYKNIFGSLRDFAIVKGRSNFKCLSYKRDGLDKPCNEGKCIEDKYFDDNYDCIDDCPYKSQRDIAKIAKILISSYRFIYYIQKAYKHLYDKKLSRKKEFTKSKRLLIMDNPNLINESFNSSEITEAKNNILNNGIHRIFISDDEIDLKSFKINDDKNYFI